MPRIDFAPKCPACKQTVSINDIVCPNCKVNIFEAARAEFRKAAKRHRRRVLSMIKAERETKERDKKNPGGGVRFAGSFAGNF